MRRVKSPTKMMSGGVRKQRVREIRSSSPESSSKCDHIIVRTRVREIERI